MLWEEVGGILSMLKLSYKNETTTCNSDLLNEVPHMYALHYKYHDYLQQAASTYIVFRKAM